MGDRETVVDARRVIAERNLESILDSAERLLVSGATLNFSAVATEAGLSRPTLYAHFVDRKQLVGALVDRTVRQAAEAMNSADPGRGRADDALRRVIAVGWEHLARHIEVAHAAAGELSVDQLHAHHRQAEEVIGRLIERGQARGTFRDDLPAAWLASSCLAVIHGAGAFATSGQMKSDSVVEALTTTVVDLCVGRRTAANRNR
jgi:TetR/AcrR family transcriptional repressor of mexCD-oprJ operon